MNKKEREKVIIFAREGFRKFYFNNPTFLTDRNLKPGKRTYRNLLSLNKMMNFYAKSAEDFILKKDVIEKTGWTGPSSYVQHERIITNFGLSDTSWKDRKRSVLLLSDEGKKIRDKYREYSSINPDVNLMELSFLPSFAQRYIIEQIQNTTADNMSLWKNVIISALYFYCEAGYLPLYARNKRDIPSVEKNAFITCFNYVNKGKLMDVSYIQQPVAMLKNLELIDENRILTEKGYKLLSKMRLLQETNDSYVDYQEMFGDEADVVAKRIDGSSEIQETAAPERLIVTVSVEENHRVRRGSHDYNRKHKRDTKIGEIGERLVLEYERNKLIECGIENVESLVFLTSEHQEYGNSYPCDIISYDPESDSEVYIEVKTTTEKSTTPFFISMGEVEFSKKYANNYKLYRVYDVLSKTEKPKFYVTFGDVEENYTLVGERYIAYREIINEK